MPINPHVSRQRIPRRRSKVSLLPFALDFILWQAFLHILKSKTRRRRHILSNLHMCSPRCAARSFDRVRKLGPLGRENSDDFTRRSSDGLLERPLSLLGDEEERSCCDCRRHISTLKEARRGSSIPPTIATRTTTTMMAAMPPIDREKELSELLPEAPASTPLWVVPGSVAE